MMVSKALFFVCLALSASMSSAFLGRLGNGLLGNTFESLKKTVNVAVDNVQEIVPSLTGGKEHSLVGNSVDKLQDTIGAAFEDLQKALPSVLGKPVEKHNHKSEEKPAEKHAEKPADSDKDDEALLDDILEAVDSLVAKVSQILANLGEGSESKVKIITILQNIISALNNTLKSVGIDVTNLLNNILGNGGLLGGILGDDGLLGGLLGDDGLLGGILGGKGSGILGGTYESIEKLLQVLIDEVRGILPDLLEKGVPAEIIDEIQVLVDEILCLLEQLLPGILGNGDGTTVVAPTTVSSKHVTPVAPTTASSGYSKHH